VLVLETESRRYPVRVTAVHGTHAPHLSKPLLLYHVTPVDYASAA
jgi:hypothetical protein